MSDTNPQMEVYCLVTYDRPHEFNNPTHRKNYTCLARNTRFRKFNLFESSNNFLKKITKNLKIIEIKKKKKKIQNHLLTLDLPKNYFVLITTIIIPSMRRKIINVELILEESRSIVLVTTHFLTFKSLVLTISMPVENPLLIIIFPLKTISVGFQ